MISRRLQDVKPPTFECCTNDCSTNAGPPCCRQGCDVQTEEALRLFLEFNEPCCENPSFDCCFPEPAAGDVACCDAYLSGNSTTACCGTSAPVDSPGPPTPGPPRPPTPGGPPGQQDEVSFLLSCVALWFPF